MNTEALRRTFHCWNGSMKIDAGKFRHLTTRAVWIDGPVIVTAKEVCEAKIVEAPEVKCEAVIDDGWLVVVVHGPVELPARASISVRMRAEIAHARWLVELLPNASDDLPALTTKAKVPTITEGELL
jgi:hypothetical protein